MAWPSKDFKNYLVNTDRHLMKPRYKRGLKDDSVVEDASPDYRSAVERNAGVDEPPRGKHINPSSRLNRAQKKRPKHSGPNA
jgi:hypothetical protein